MEITRWQRHEVKDTYHRVVRQIGIKYEDDPAFDYLLSFPYYMESPCRVTFSPMVWRKTHRRLLVDKEKIAALRRRMLEIEALLRDEGIEAYACGRWHYYIGVCGND